MITESGKVNFNRTTQHRANYEGCPKRAANINNRKNFHTAAAEGISSNPRHDFIYSYHHVKFRVSQKAPNITKTVTYTIHQTIGASLWGKPRRETRSPQTCTYACSISTRQQYEECNHATVNSEVSSSAVTPRNLKMAKGKTPVKIYLLTNHHNTNRHCAR